MNGESIDYRGFSSKSRINRCSDYPGAPLSFGLVVELILGNNPKEKSPMTDVLQRLIAEPDAALWGQSASRSAPIRTVLVQLIDCDGNTAR